ncbi:MAG: hypothetical protein R3D58_13695 [Saprospiraceae bacterium]
MANSKKRKPQKETDPDYDVRKKPISLIIPGLFTLVGILLTWYLGTMIFQPKDLDSNKEANPNCAIFNNISGMVSEIDSALSESNYDQDDRLLLNAFKEKFELELKNGNICSEERRHPAIYEEIKSAKEIINNHIK